MSAEANSTKGRLAGKNAIITGAAGTFCPAAPVCYLYNSYHPMRPGRRILIFELAGFFLPTRVS